MNYEEKYKEALKDMRAIYPNLKGAAKLAVEHAFPELRESEDERIRKWIASYIHHGVFTEEEHPMALKAVEWLEKQKKNRMQPVYDNQESFESALDKAWKSYNESGARTVDSCEDDYVECAHAKGFREGYLFGLEKQKGLDKMIVVSPEVWDNAITDAYENGKRDSEKQKEQKPAEWSEEEIIYWNTIKDYFFGIPLDDKLKSALDWFKSLRPSWKPSEEQMKALLNAEGFLRAGLQHDSAKTIAELYEQLKKL